MARYSGNETFCLRLIGANNFPVSNIALLFLFLSSFTFVPPGETFLYGKSELCDVDCTWTKIYRSNVTFNWRWIGNKSKRMIHDFTKILQGNVCGYFLGIFYAKRLYETFGDFIKSVARFDCYDYINHFCRTNWIIELVKIEKNNNKHRRKMVNSFNK